MKYLYVKQKVEDFVKWYDIFKSHEKAQKEAGLKDLQLFRDEADPNTVICLFRVEDINKAKAFTRAPEAEEAQEQSGMIEPPEVLYLDKI